MHKIPSHIAIIMDGNGRWARRRGLPRTEGHRRGMKVIRETIETARSQGIKFLTLYAFSTENWRRPGPEVSFLLKMCESMLAEETPVMVRKNIRFRHIGRREGLPQSLQRVIDNASVLTQANRKLSLQLAFNYGGRSEIVDAVKTIAAAVADSRLRPDDITEKTLSEALYTSGIPDPDLLIRTSGEMRISNFLLWQIGYSEIYVTKKYWPDFNKRELLRAIHDYQKRQRRFGGCL